MIKIVDGDILKAKEDILAHQTNCQGVMGSGIAKQIKDKYPEVFEQYRKFFVNNKFTALGKCQIVKAEEGKYVANLFGQYKYGTDKQHTDYKALEEALFSLKVSAKDNNKSVAIPYNIGCCRGGGSWEVVYKIIEEVFSDYEITLYRFK